jgi:hypothetical protein
MKCERDDEQNPVSAKEMPTGSKKVVLMRHWLLKDN